MVALCDEEGEHVVGLLELQAKGFEGFYLGKMILEELRLLEKVHD